MNDLFGGRMVSAHDSDGFLIAGYGGIDLAGHYDVFVLRLDNTRELTWARYYDLGVTAKRFRR